MLAALTLLLSTEQISSRQMNEIELLLQLCAVRALATARATQHKHELLGHEQLTSAPIHLTNVSLSVHCSQQTQRVHVFDHRVRLCRIRLETLHECLHVVIGASARLAALENASSHGLL